MLSSSCKENAAEVRVSELLQNMKFKNAELSKEKIHNDLKEDSKTVYYDSGNKNKSEFVWFGKEGYSMKIITERLEIRLLENSEMESMISNEKNSALKSAYTSMYHRTIKNLNQREWNGIWGMFFKNKNDMIGSLAFKGISDDGQIEIGYGIDKEYENNGYMTEAVIGLCKWASEQSNVNKIIAEVEDTNVSSIRVLEKSNFLKTDKRGEEGFIYILK